MTIRSKIGLLVTVVASYLASGCASTPLSSSKKHLIPVRNSTAQPVASFRVPSGWRIGYVRNLDRVTMPYVAADYVLEHGSSQVSMSALQSEPQTRGAVNRVEEVKRLFLNEFAGMHDSTLTLTRVTKANSAYGNVDINHYRGADANSSPMAMVLLIDAGREVYFVAQAFTEAEMKIALAGLEDLLLSVRFFDQV